MSVTPDSSARICWVRSAMRAACSVGSPSASSNALVCSDWVPPIVAAIAWTVVRTMLFSGCWAVRVDPAVWVWNRIRWAAGSVTPESVLHQRRPQSSGRPEFGCLFEQVIVRIPEKREPWRKLAHIESCRNGRFDIRDAIGNGERDLLRRGRAGFADVVAADRNRVPVGKLGIAIRKQICHKTHRGLRRVDIGPPGDVLLENVVLHRAADLLRGDSLFFGHQLIQQQQDGARWR